MPVEVDVSSFSMPKTFLVGRDEQRKKSPRSVDGTGASSRPQRGTGMGRSYRAFREGAEVSCMKTTSTG